MIRLVARLTAVLAGAGLLVVHPAMAQSYLFGASAELASGLEGGGAGPTTIALARARLRLAGDLRVDEFPADAVGVGLLLDFEPRSAFGIDAHYIRSLGKRFEVGAGGIAYVAPESLFGPSASLKYRMPLSASTRLTVGPDVNVFVVGSDLPSGTIVWQVLIQVGLHADL